MDNEKLDKIVDVILDIAKDKALNEEDKTYLLKEHLMDWFIFRPDSKPVHKGA